MSPTGKGAAREEHENHGEYVETAREADAYRQSWKSIGSRVGRNQTTVMRICDRWMQEGTTDRRVRLHPSQCTTLREDRRIVRMAVTDRSVTSRTVAHHIEITHLSATPRWSDLSLETPWRKDAEQLRYALPQWSCTGIKVWGGIAYHSRTPLVRIDSTLNSQRYISEVLEPVVLPYFQSLDTAIFQQDNARPHVARIVQRFFVNHNIELLPWLTRSPDLSPIEYIWSMVAQRLTQISSPAAPPHQLWQRVEAAWSTCYLQKKFCCLSLCCIYGGQQCIEQRLKQSRISARRLLLRSPVVSNHRCLRAAKSVINGGFGQRNGTTRCLLKNPASTCCSTMVGFENGETVVRGG
ncbi:transposable element Tcb1 transposase [Trichonephila clavipes]|nr:transposable element Tcb1 transposase [Trichonephila clavipes]